MTQQIKNSSIEAWMLQCLEMNGNCLIGNKRIRNHGIEKIEKDFHLLDANIIDCFENAKNDPQIQVSYMEGDEINQDDYEEDEDEEYSFC